MKPNKENTERKWALFIPSKGYWSVSPFDGVGFVNDIFKATLFTDVEIKNTDWIAYYKKPYHVEHKWIEADIEFKNMTKDKCITYLQDMIDQGCLGDGDNSAVKWAIQHLKKYGPPIEQS